MTTSKSAKTFELSPPGRLPGLVFAAALLLPLLVLAGIWAMDRDSFTDMPGWALGLIFGLAPAILLSGLVGNKTPTAQLGPDGLQVRASFLKKQWPLAALDRHNARQLDLDANEAFRPRWKLFGVGLPGLSSGHFKLRNGQSAHVYITQRRKVVYIPAGNGAILLSMERAKEFIDTLQGL